MPIDSTSPASGDGSVSGALDGDQSPELGQDNGGAAQNRQSKGAAVAVACIVSVSGLNVGTG